MTDEQRKRIRESPFNGTEGWMTIDNFCSTIGVAGKRYDELGYQLIEEATTLNGTIWINLKKL